MMHGPINIRFNMKVFVCPSPPDLRHSIAVFDGSKSSATCPSGKGNINMSRDFGGGKKIINTIKSSQADSGVEV